MKKKKERKTWELHRHCKKWTPEEEDLLKQLYPNVFTHELEERFGRRGRNIGIKASRLGIKKNWRKYTPAKNDKRWSKKETKRLEKLYPVMPTTQLLARFPKRTKTALTNRAQMLGLKKNYLNCNRAHEQLSSKLWLWSAKDIERLRKLWQKGHTDSQIAKIMGKNIKRIRYQINKQIRDERLQKKCKWWSKEEEEYLKRHYHQVSIEQIAAVLGRTAEMIHNKAGRLKITQPGHWSPEEIETLRKLWQEDHTAAQIAEIIGRTKRAVFHELTRQKQDFGLQGKIKPWSKKERNYLKKHYQDKSNAQIAAELGRTTGMIHGMAVRLRLVKRTSWTVKEINFLKEHYCVLPNAQIAKLIDRTTEGIQIKAAKLGLKKQEPWPREKVEFLKQYYTQWTATKIAQKLGKTTGAIRRKALSMGLRKK